MRVPTYQSLPIYRHTQTGWTIILTVGGGAAICGFLYLNGNLPGEPSVVLVLVTVILSIALGLFWSLTVTVDRTAVEFRFGPIGVIHRSFPVAQIASAQQVKNRLLCGWGVHYCSGAILYNVHGFDAVEITLADGSRHRIGTSEPEKLLRAIQLVAGYSEMHDELETDNDNDDQ